MPQQNPKPADEAAEVVAGGGENSVGCVPVPEPEIVSAHAMLGFEVADDGFDGGPAAQLTLVLRRHASLLPREKDPELILGWPR